MALTAKSFRQSASLCAVWPEFQADLQRNCLGAVSACLARMQQSVELLHDVPLAHARQAALNADLADQARLLGSLLTAELAPTASPQLVSPDALLSDLVEDCRRRFPRFRFNLALAAPATGATGIWPQLKLAFALLMENAMRCAPSSSEISVSVALDPGGQSWVVSFHDQGPGIAHDRLALVFEDPRRAGPARLFGMGITLARSLVEAIGGCLRVDSGPGGGATFSIGLPRKLPLRRWIVPRPRVLVIDEDPQLRAALAARLREAGYRVQTAANAGVGLARAEALCPDLVVLEFTPAPHGDDSTLAQLRRVSDAAVVFISAHSDKGILADALWLGASDYLAKPFDVRELLARAGAILRRRQQLPRPEPVTVFGPPLGIGGKPPVKHFLQ